MSDEHWHIGTGEVELSMAIAKDAVEACDARRNRQV